MNVITGKTQEVYDFIIRYKSIRDGIAPTVREIGQETDIASESHVIKHLKKLEAAGLIRRFHYAPRAIMVTGGKWRLENER